MNKEIIVGTNTLLQMAEQLYSRGEITDAQIAQIRANARKVSEEHKKDIVIL